MITNRQPPAYLRVEPLVRYAHDGEIEPQTLIKDVEDVSRLHSMIESFRNNKRYETVSFTTNYEQLTALRKNSAGVITLRVLLDVEAQIYKVLKVPTDLHNLDVHSTALSSLNIFAALFLNVHVPKNIYYIRVCVWDLNDDNIEVHSFTTELQGTFERFQLDFTKDGHHLVLSSHQSVQVEVECNESCPEKNNLLPSSIWEAQPQCDHPPFTLDYQFEQVCAWAMTFSSTFMAYYFPFVNRAAGKLQSMSLKKFDKAHKDLWEYVATYGKPIHYEFMYELDHDYLGARLESASFRETRASLKRKHLG